uniref:t-SNARE coiled-coil homology domain-containing protein n=1 Tax=Plectus sambesii TaxID=2011161 RepID=A0A914UVZ7_9BILA
MADMNWMRASIAIERFERVAQMQIRELGQHTTEISQCRSQGDHRGVERVEINMKRTVQQLLQGLRQVLALRGELSDLDQERFDARIEPIRLKTQRAVNELSVLSSTSSTSFLADSPPESPIANAPSSSLSHQQQLQAHRVRAEELRLRAEQAKEEAETHARLNEEIAELNQIMVDMSLLVHAQHEVVDSIEEHVEQAESNLKSGNRDLKKAVKYKTARYPIAGGVIGAAAVGGPVGFAAGSAIAAVCAAVGGAVAGLYGGKMLKEKTEEEASGADPCTTTTSRNDRSIMSWF